ncbi:glycosyltransferase family 4 protein [Rahnella bruchi]|uniref:glycosyltransferase family 4 protein n=1 Tax=Rahnella bruchi TaxID=1510573 RepID=UPI000EA06A7E|nr:glycosyltransferase family 4 protein [Rahnella bruchi]
MKKEKVLYVDTCHDVAGGQRSLIALLEKINDKIDFNILIDKNNSKYKTELLNSGISESHIHYIDSKPFNSRILGGINLMLRTLGRSKYYAIVHCNTFYDGLFAMPSFRLRGCKTVFRARCGIELSNHGFVDNVIYRLSTVILANSEYVKSTFKRVSDSLNKIRVIYNPLDLKFLNRANVEFVQDNEQYVISVIGAITEVKNQMEVLQALYLMNDTSVKLRFIGEPRSTEKDKEYYKQIQKFTHEHNLHEQVEFTGFVSDVRQQLHDVNLVCVPSDREPLGRVIFETQLYEIPVLASDSGGNTELVENNITGYLYELGNVEQLAEKLKLVKADHSQIKTNAKDFIVKRFSPERTYLAELSLYTDILK